MIFLLLLEVKPKTSCKLNKGSATILCLLFSPFLIEKNVHFNLFCVERDGAPVVVGVWRSEESFQEFVLSFRHSPKDKTLLLLAGLATGAFS